MGFPPVRKSPLQFCLLPDIRLRGAAPALELRIRERPIAALSWLLYDRCTIAQRCLTRKINCLIHSSSVVDRSAACQEDTCQESFSSRSPIESLHSIATHPRLLPSSSVRWAHLGVQDSEGGNPRRNATNSQAFWRV